MAVTEIFETDAGEAELDNRKRISLGKVATHGRYRIHTNGAGDILLTPVVSISARELAALQNPALMARLDEGIRSIEAGEGVPMGDLSEWLED